MTSREKYERREMEFLVPYAQLSSQTLGRKYKEEDCPFRSSFQRDLARIIHSSAFRKLEYKTQVFINHEDDHYRTRLTHSLEVSQISKGLARIFGLNEDLAQTIALAHDLGHTPFGHPGEKMMNILMESDGGFEHNFQSYRVVTKLENNYPGFKGLNLTYEVLEGILSHTTSYDSPKKDVKFKSVGYPTLEAQIVNLADEIAFMNHDLDDSLQCGLLTLESLKNAELWDATFKSVKKSLPTASDHILKSRTISGLIGQLIDDLQNETKKRIRENNIETLEDVRRGGNNIVSFSESMAKKTHEVKRFLFDNIYRHPTVVKASQNASNILKALFNEQVRGCNDKRDVCDHIAGLTDRMALKEYDKITNSKKLFD